MLDARVDDWAQPYDTIGKLFRTLRADYESGGRKLYPSLRSLALRVPEIRDLELHIPLPELPDIVDLRLEILNRNPHECMATAVYMGSLGLLLWLARGFQRHTNTTLKTLAFFSDPIDLADDYRLLENDLSDLDALEHLDIQGDIFGGLPLMGKRKLIPALPAKLSKRLPPNLRTLQLRCYSRSVSLWSYGNEFKKVQLNLAEAMSTVDLLREYLELHEPLQPYLEKVVVWLPKAEGEGWPKEMCKFSSMLEAASKVGLQRGVKIIAKVVDDSQPGTYRNPSFGTAYP